MTQQVDLVVTRHQGLVEYLMREGIVDEGVRVVPHATADMLRGLRVCGVLPLSLAAHCAAVLVVPLDDLPREMRGRELSADEVARYAGPPTWYAVERLPSRQMECIAERILRICGVDLIGIGMPYGFGLDLLAVIERLRLLMRLDDRSSMAWAKACEDADDIGMFLGEKDFAQKIIAGLDAKKGES